MENFISKREYLDAIKKCRKLYNGESHDLFSLANILVRWREHWRKWEPCRLKTISQNLKERTATSENVAALGRADLY
jgi:hypothetical protein